jgi:cyclopropane-fatty-acyl-phospholipid synthase
MTMAANVESGSAAESLGPLLRALLGRMLPVRLEFWDGSVIESDAPNPPGTVRVNSPEAVRRLLWSPDELGLGRAYVAGDLDADGDIVAMVEVLRDATPKDLRLRSKAALEAIAAARRAGVIGAPLPPPPQEARLKGWRHSLGRDRRAISHHYDVGNDFYRIVLGPSMTYSCARFVDDEMSLDDAQAAKHDLVARKLGLDQREGMRLLDVGCGWGSMAIHAATRYRAEVVGITISREQVELAQKRVV